MTRGKWTSLQRVVERNSLNIAVEWHFSKEDLLWLSGFVTSFLLETWSLVMFLLELFLNFMVLKWPFPTFLFSGQKLWITRCWRQSKQTQTPSWTERSLTTARWGVTFYRYPVWQSRVCLMQFWRWKCTWTSSSLCFFLLLWFSFQRATATTIKYLRRSAKTSSSDRVSLYWSKQTIPP